MPPQSDAAHGAEITTTAGNRDDGDEEELPFKDRMRIRIINLMHSLRLFIYNKEHQTMFGNSSSGWIKISIYYFFFYACLGLFYSGMVAVFGAIVSRQSPTYGYNNSALNDNGYCYIGMGFRPMPDITDISITVYSDPASQNDTISSLANYVSDFLTQRDTTNVKECSPTEPASQLLSSQSCKFSWGDIVTTDKHPCSAANGYGWPVGKPCMLIKLNKIYGWVPTAGNVTDKVMNATGQPVLSVDQRENNVYITCNGQDAVDTDVLGNMVFYSILHPLGNPNYGGIPYYFFPYLNSMGHVQPFVLVQFTSLPLNRLVSIECRAWAPNIQQASVGTQSRGMTSFNLYRSNQGAPPKT